MSEPDQQILRLSGEEGIRQIRLRWAVAPLMLAGVGVATALGFQLAIAPIILIALAILVYNTLFAVSFRRDRIPRLIGEIRLATALQVVADYTAVFLLIHFTGGARSPLVVLLFFHVILAGMQVPSGMAHIFAGLAAGGMWMLFAAEVRGWWPSVPIYFRGRSIGGEIEPVELAISLVFFTAALFVTAALVSQIMRRLRDRVIQSAASSRDLARANERFRALYSMVGAIGVRRSLQSTLDTAVNELALLTEVPAAAIKLLREDGRTLRYAAARGLPSEVVRGTVIDPDLSPWNRRILGGETIVHGRVGAEDSVQLSRELAEMGIRSAVLAPLKLQERVIGVLSIYARRPDRFGDADSEFVALAAELIAIAIEDAQSNEAVEEAARERTRLMLEVAHNLRAPIGAVLSMLALLEDGTLGDVNPKQKRSLERIDRRLQGLNQTIGELLTIARARDWTQEIPDVVVDPAELAGYTEHTFREQAESRQLKFVVEVEPHLSTIDSGADLLEKVMENLVSNAIKYTPERGEVSVRLERQGSDRLRITVRDTGIGIPENEQKNLFKEFFRASNAKEFSATGTGLGLALAKQSVERHGGSLTLTSHQGIGTTVVVELPFHRDRKLDCSGQRDS